MAAIEYRVGNDIGTDVMVELYVASTLGERRPVHSRGAVLMLAPIAQLLDDE